ncbi:MAG: tRNA (N6-isopentenyl adenosine(37)-C2)-methylthiotransferase MiaB [Candidatus Omnitrophica bacterium]|nr:tRNA (N6-isopentenyl adenosine(37)-C2)-methylthiotransferase MiaB [Candidatus Omnitrophota bacterium]
MKDKDNNIKDITPNSMRLKNLSKAHFSNQSSECHPKVFIKTFGCQMNDYDSEILRGILRKRGFVVSGDLESADIVLFNTCSVREHAERRVYGQIASLAHGKGQMTNGKMIGLVGCMAQAHKEKILKDLPYVDLVCGPQHIYQIPDYLEDIILNKKKIVAVDEKQRPADRENHDFRDETKRIKAYVTIMEGCNNFCSYCIVPYVRGREKSRPPELIIKEITSLLKRGIKEITLLGQNVNSYGKDIAGGYSFCDLLKKIDAIGDLRRLRFVTSHPKDAEEEMFRAMAKLPTICESLHLPVQSGSDRILKCMNRKYSKDDYLRKIELLRKIVPGCSLSTDIIVGYPGETDEDFRQTVEIIKQVRYDTAYIFKYSPRPLTRAAGLEDDVPQSVKEERNQELLNLQKKIVRCNNEKYRNKELGVLVESASDKDEKFLVGRSRTGKMVVFEGPRELIGKIIGVRVGEVNTSTLSGEWARL